MYKFWQKRDWNCAFMALQNTHSLMKRRDAPLQPPEISVNLDKKGLKWCNLARKIQNFLRQGGTAPLRPPKLYIGLRINFDRKGTKIVHLWFRNTHSFKKRRTAPCDHQKSYISEIQTKKGLKLCIFGSQNAIFLSGKGHFPLANPARGPAPWTLWTPRTSAQSARFAGSWAPHVEILPKHMDSTPPIIHIHLTHYTLAISQYVNYVHVCKKKNIKMIIFRICLVFPLRIISLGQFDKI